MRLTITGSKGQLGRALMRRLAQHDLLGVDLPEVDLTDLNAARSSLAAFKPDVIIHAAAYTDVDGAARNPDLAYRVNALGTRNVAVASEAIGAALLAISTNEVFDGAKPEPYLEFDPTNPINPYAKSKLAAEQFVRDLTTPLLHCAHRVAVWLGRQQLRQEDHRARRHGRPVARRHR